MREPLSPGLDPKDELLDNLPGADLVRTGLKDLQEGRSDTVEALLVAIGSPRLGVLGFELPYAFSELPEHELYARLCELHGDEAHSRYNALTRLLVSFERALDGRLRRRSSDF